MRDKPTVVIMIATCVAVLIGIMALGISFSRIDSCSISGIIIGALTILVTLLIGWNIYTIIDIKDIRKEFEKIKVENKEELERVIDKLRCENESMKKQLKFYSTAVSHISTGDAFINFNNGRSSFLLYVSGLVNAYESGDDYLISLALEDLLSNIQKISALVAHKDLQSRKDLIERLRDGLAQHSDERAYKLYSQLFCHEPDPVDVDQKKPQQPE